MHSPQPRFGRHNILLFFLLLLFCMTAGPPRPWARSQAAAQCAILITPLMLPGGSVGVPYSQNLNAIGGSGRLSFGLIANSLPPGLTLSPASGLISGTPNTTGTYSFLIRATDANDCSATRAYTITVDCGRITLDPTRLPDALSSTAYTQILSASGGREPYNYSILQGALPPGLTLSPTGTIAGTPTTVGRYDFTVRARDANNCPGNEFYTLDVTCLAITISPLQLLTRTVGELFTQSFTVSGGQSPFNFSLASGTLPPGVTFSSSNTISGTPTAAGNYDITVRVTDANGCTGERQYRLIIRNAPCPTITVSPSLRPDAQVGVAYNQTFSATGGTAPYTFGIPSGASPPGLSLAPNGNLTGTPTAAGDFRFTVRATDANACVGELVYAVSVLTCAGITLNPASDSLPSGRIDIPYNQTFTVAGGTETYMFSLATGSSLPPGLRLSSGGLLSGTPTMAGDFSLTIVAIPVPRFSFTHGLAETEPCPVERTYTLVINNPACPTLTINPNNLPAGRVGTPYSQTFTGTGGTSPYAFSLSRGALPGGLALSPGGTLAGTPTAAGDFSFTVRATDANGCVGERALSIIIAVNTVVSVSAASFAAGGPLATESIATAFGSDLAAGTQVASRLPLPTELAGITLRVKDSAGAERLAPLFFVSPTQINFQIPPGSAVGLGGVTVMDGGMVTAAGAIEIAEVAPGLFSADASGRGLAAAVALRVKSDGTQSYEPIARFDTAQDRLVAAPIDLGPSTDEIFVLFYGTGWKFRSALSAVSCSIGGVSSEVLYAGEAPGFVGLDQINARLSRSLAGRGEVDVSISVDGKAANTVRLAIR